MTSDPHSHNTRLVLGYHGTDLAAAQSIVGGRFRYTKGGRELHLGPGSYFYEGSRQSAIGWARNVMKVSLVGVVKSEIDLGNCLDFFDEELQLSARKIAKILAARSRPQTMASLVEYFCEMRQFDTIRAVQLDTGRNSGPIVDDSEQYPRSRVVICVKNIDKIKKSTLDFQKRFD